VDEIVALDPTRLLVRSRGADALFNSADDVTFILRDLGPRLETVELPTPYSHYFSQTLRLSPTRVLVSTNGPDGEVTTADDEILLLDYLDGTPTVTPLAVPMLMRSTLVALGPDLAVAAARGPGAPHHDELVVLRDLGGSNYVYEVHVGVLGTETWLEGGRGAPVRIGPRTAAIATLGPDGAWPSADDQVATLTVTGQGAELRTLGVPYLSWRALLPLPPTGVLVSSIGPGDDPENARDDAAFALGGLPSAPAFRRRRAPSFGGYPIFTGQPTLLGNGRAVYQDWVAEDGSNDRPHHLQVIRGLEGGVRLRARKISIRFGPAGDARLAAAADLFVPEPERFASSDLAVRVGNATQTIHRSSFEATATGFRYLDPGGGNGFLRRVEYDAAASRLEIEGQGTGTGAETTKASNLVLSLESLDLYVAESLDGEKRRGGIFYRRR